MTGKSFTETYISSSEEQSDFAGQQIRLAERVGQVLGESAFSEWQKGAAGQEALTFARRGQFERSRHRRTGGSGRAVARFGFSYDDRFYEFDAQELEAHLRVTVVEREVAAARRRRLLPNAPGEVMWRSLLIKSEVIIEEFPFPPPISNLQAMLQDYRDAYGSVTSPIWGLDCPKLVYTRFAFRPDGSLCTAMVYGDSQPIRPQPDSKNNNLISALGTAVHLLDNGPPHFTFKSN